MYTIFDWIVVWNALARSRSRYENYCTQMLLCITLIESKYTACKCLILMYGRTALFIYNYHFQNGQLL